MHDIIKAAADSRFVFFVRKKLGLCASMPDEEYLSKQFRRRMGYELRLDAPVTFNEKLQWLKLNDRKPEYTKMVDKYEAKRVAAGLIGESYIIPTLGVWNSFDEINFDALPDEFVLKCTHDSGGIVFCRDKASFDKRSAEKKLKDRLGRNHYLFCREWPYKNVVPRILAEQFMRNRDSRNLSVYKIFNFSGVPKIIQAVQDDKTKDETIDYFDTDWNLLELRQNFRNSEKHLEKPGTLEEMLGLAEKLSKGFPFLRTDFYEINGKVYFSEFTFYSDAGFRPFHPESWDTVLGEWIVLPNIKNGE